MFLTLLFGILITMTTLLNATETIIEKSQNDQRDYVYSTLDNGLKLLVISDKDAQRAAVAVNVEVGSAADPDAFPGLAHFLEHMLFLGTDHYPNPDDYINFISEHGGNHNAFTAFEQTNYFFDIDPDYLHEGLKRFSRFFVAPLLSDKYVERERHAVDSEYQSKLGEDGWRSMDSFKQIVNPKHPYARFSIGNNETLPNKTVRPALETFYQTHYSAERMSVVIIGKENTATLKEWGTTLFTDVPKRQTQELKITARLFEEIKLPIMVRSQSIKNEYNLSLQFYFSYEAETDYDKSLNYLSYLMGYEGKGSLLAALKQQGYANKLYSGAGYRIGQESSFEIGIELTKKGYQQVNQVSALVFAYLDKLKAQNNGQQLYNELATIAKTAFQFKEKTAGIHEVSQLATRLSRYPAKDILSINAKYTGYHPEKIQGYLAQMTADHVALQLTAPDIDSDKKTRYFSVPFSVTHPTVKSLTTLTTENQAVARQMHLPHSNPFVATDYRLQSSQVKEIVKTLDSGVELYYRHDTGFNVPRSSVQISLQPALALTVKDKTQMTLFAALVEEALTTTLYDASLAGVQTHISAGEKSIILSLNGYSEKIPQLLELILKQLKQPIDSQLFARVWQDYQQSLENTVTNMPYQQTFSHLNKALIEEASLPEERLQALKKINEKSLKSWVDKHLKNLAIRLLVYGNTTLEQAQSLGQLFSTVLDKSHFKNRWQPNRPKPITETIEQTFTVDHADNAISYYLPAASGYTARAMVGLLANMISPQFFTQLRTEKQLGYVVFAYPRPIYNQAGLAFTIQSPVASADELENHIIDFNKNFSKKLSQLTLAEFKANQLILKTELQQQPENIRNAAELYWSDILTTGKTESTRQQIAKAVDDLALDDFINQMQTVLTQQLSVVIKAKAQKP